MAIEIPKGISIKDFFLSFMPQAYKEATKGQDLSAYAGVDATFVVEIKGGEGGSYTLAIKNGADLTISAGSAQGALAYVEIDSNLISRFLKEDLPAPVMAELKQSLANPENITSMVTGVEPAAAKQKLALLKSIQGKIGLKADVDGEIFETAVRLNGAASPTFSIVGKFPDLLGLARGEINPIQGFMSGKYKIEGDMSLAMRMQPLMS